MKKNVCIRGNQELEVHFEFNDVLSVLIVKINKFDFSSQRKRAQSCRETDCCEHMRCYRLDCCEHMWCCRLDCCERERCFNKKNCPCKNEFAGCKSAEITLIGVGRQVNKRIKNIITDSAVFNCLKKGVYYISVRYYGETYYSRVELNANIKKVTVII